MTTRFSFLLRALAVALLAALVLAMPAAADDHDHDDDDDHAHGTATTTATSGSGDDDRFGAFIHAGTCEAPGDVVEEIDELDDDRDDDDAVWQRIGGDDPAPEVLYDEDEDIGQTVDELTAGEFVVAVHEGEGADSPIIACGAITGEVGADGSLVIDLDEVDDSGFEGRAHLAPDDDSDDDDNNDDDDQTEVTVGLWEVTTPGGV